MLSRISLAAVLVLLAAGPSWGAVIGTNPPAQPLTAARVAALPAEQQAAWLDYLARSKDRRAADHAAVAAELKSAGLTQPVIPPPGRGGMPLEFGASWYGGAIARQTADVIVSYQMPNGGWSKDLNMRDHARPPGGSFIGDNRSPVPPIPGDYSTTDEPDWNYFGTLDNDATTTQLRFLARVITALGPERSAVYRASFLRGIDYLFASQYPNGGWPQVWPLQGGYHDAITFNDDAMTQALEVLEGVAEGQGMYAFTAPELRQRAAARVARGIECVLACQVVANGRKTVWCQQHDALTLQPASARNYEPPAQASVESTAVVTFLMSLPQPSPAVVASVQAAAAWFERTAIQGQVWSRGRSAGAPGPGVTHLLPEPGAEPIWARYYEIGSDRPIFGDRDLTLHDRIEEISVERQNGYQWYARAGSRLLPAYAVWSKAHPPVAP